MRFFAHLTPAIIFLALTACSSKEINWHKGSVESALKLAKDQGRPVFLYWGATWCPPCNRLKAEVFPDKAVVDALKPYVSIYLDGDDPRAQVWADRLNTRGYPTLLVLNSSGKELTRFPGEIEKDQFAKLLNRYTRVQLTTEEVLRKALSGKKLKKDEWEVLSSYDWYGDQKNLLPDGDVSTFGKLFTLSEGQPDRFRSKFFFEFLSLSKEELSEQERKRFRDYLEMVLKDSELVRLNSVHLSFSASSILSKLKVNDRIYALYEKALRSLSEDPSSPAVQAYAMNGRGFLHRWKFPKKEAPKALRQNLVELIKAIDKNVKQTTQRKSVLSNAVWSLIEVGELDVAETIARREAKASIGEYGSILGYILVKRGQKTEGLKWYFRGYQAHTGSASRFQKGVQYVSELLKHFPNQFKKIKEETSQIVKDVFEKGDGFSGRNRKQFKVLAASLSDWKNKNKNARFNSLLKEMKRLCGQSENRKDCMLWVKKLSTPTRAG